MCITYTSLNGIIAQFKVIKEENTIIAVFPIELDMDLSIITNNVFVNSTNIYGKTNKNVLKIFLLNLCFIFYPLTYFYSFSNFNKCVETINMFSSLFLFI